MFPDFLSVANSVGDHVPSFNWSVTLPVVVDLRGHQTRACMHQRMDVQQWCCTRRHSVQADPNTSSQLCMGSVTEKREEREGESIC